MFDSAVGLYEAKSPILLHTIPEGWHFRSGSIEKNFVIVSLFAPCNDVKPKLSFMGTSTLKIHQAMLYACNGYFIQDGRRKFFHSRLKLEGRPKLLQSYSSHEH